VLPSAPIITVSSAAELTLRSASSLVPHLAHPGGNVTGAGSGPDLTAQRIELVAQLIPNLSWLALLVVAGDPASSCSVHTAARISHIFAGDFGN